MLLDPFNGYYIFKKQLSKHISITMCNTRINHNGKCILILMPYSCRGNDKSKRICQLAGGFSFETSYENGENSGAFR